MAQPAKQWGTTPPISTAMPRPEDHKQNGEMIEELKRENNYEAPPETQKRIRTLELLQKTLVEFVREVSRKMRLPQSQIEQFGGQIYAYGSYRLGVYGPGQSSHTKLEHAL
jgi:poly(A) polymerase